MQQVIEIHIGWDPAPFLEIGFCINMRIIQLRKQKKLILEGLGALEILLDSSMT